MKEKTIKIAILFIILAIFLGCFTKSKAPREYKILSVIEADKFYIDINKNDKIDKDELFELKNVKAFKPSKSYYQNYILKVLAIKEEDYLKNGYIAQRWAKEELTNKNVELINFNPKKKRNGTTSAKIKYQNEDLEKILLQNGLAYPVQRKIKTKYYDLFNRKQLKNNSENLKNTNFVLVNEKTNIVHKPNCKLAKKISNIKLKLFKEINPYNEIQCKSCMEKETNKFKFKIPKNKKKYLKSQYIKDNNIELYLINPLVQNLPDTNCNTDICKRIVKEINLANSEIEIATYNFGNQKEILNALKNAKNRGVIIKSACDKNKENQPDYAHFSKFIEEFNPKINNKNSLMHNKYIIFDNKKVLTGSMNISSTGSGGYNSNSVVIINDEKITKLYEHDFSQMHAGNFSKNKNQLDKDCKNNDICAYFSPNDDILENLIIPNIKNAKKSIYISIFYLTDKKLINELISARKRNIEILILIDALGAINFKDRIEYLRKNNIPTIVENWGGKNHEKTILIDEEIVIMGSCNLSYSGFKKNDENMVYIKNKTLGEFYSDYYLYLFNSINPKFLKEIPHPEGFDSKNSCKDNIDNDFDGKIDSEDEGCKIIKP